DRGAASATGDRGAASATGYQGAASATGDRGAASATGDRGAASATGSDSIAITTGWHGKAKGAVGCGLMLAERDDYGHLIGVKAVLVDGKRIKPDTWYGLHGGRVVRVDDDGEPITKAVPA
ncbi:MAG: hypothetical protein AAGC63_15495, partial [Propionicimonas sp.]|nr:hypothetical protein [Propionicimonas sp.]